MSAPTTYVFEHVEEGYDVVDGGALEAADQDDEEQGEDAGEENVEDAGEQGRGSQMGLSTTTLSAHDADVDAQNYDDTNEQVTQFVRTQRRGSLSLRRSQLPAGETREDMEEVEINMIRDEGMRGRQQAKEMEMERRKRNSKRKRKITTQSIRLPDHLSRLMGAANYFFTIGDYAPAHANLLPVVQEAPKSLDAWSQLAEVAEEMGKVEDAMGYWTCAGFLGLEGAWERAGDAARSLGKLDQAVYCYTRAALAKRTETRSLLKRASIHGERGDVRKQISTLTLVLRRDPSDSAALRAYAAASLLTPDPSICIHHFNNAFLLDLMDGRKGVQFADSDDPEDQKRRRRIGYEEVDALCAVYIALGEYEQCVSKLKLLTRIIQDRIDEAKWWDDMGEGDAEFDEGREGPPGTEERARWLTVGLRVRLGVCRLMMDDGELARVSDGTFSTYRCGYSHGFVSTTFHTFTQPHIPQILRRYTSLWLMDT
ncbi:transcription factor TFIIIC subunit tfc4 [Gonapodya sp. JEL0774]|nr:transcription factor TFIIIC subunit tfc4 [Gonapodya sp. JEL0774]